MNKIDQVYVCRLRAVEGNLEQIIAPSIEDGFIYFNRILPVEVEGKSPEELDDVYGSTDPKDIFELMWGTQSEFASIDWINSETIEFECLGCPDKVFAKMAEDQNVQLELFFLDDDEECGKIVFEIDGTQADENYSSFSAAPDELLEMLGMDSEEIREEAWHYDEEDSDDDEDDWDE